MAYQKLQHFHMQIECGQLAVHRFIQRVPRKNIKIEAQILSSWYFLVLQHIRTRYVSDKGKQREGECFVFLLNMALLLCGHYEFSF